jgi:hypothetical protein
LAHIIFGEGIIVDPTKTEAIMEWPTPKNVQEVCSFMGLEGYYQCFVEDFQKYQTQLLSCKRRIRNSYGERNVLKHFRSLKNY